MTPELTPWQTEQLMIYGPCPLCRGPLSPHTTVTGTPPDITITEGLRCLWCGQMLTEDDE